MTAGIFQKYYTERYSSFKQHDLGPEERWNHEFVLVPHERIMKFTSLLAMPVVDSRGFAIGKVKDIAVNVPAGGDFPSVTGLVTENRFISWNEIGGFGDSFKLTKRTFELGTPQIYKDTIFVGRRILDEQLVHEEKNIGRVDDVKFTYDNKENRMKIIGICCGVLARLGFKGFYDTIPWTCVEHIRNETPTAIILNLKNKNFSSIPIHDVQGLRRV